MKSFFEFIAEETLDIHQLAAKHGLKVKNKGKAIHDFNYTNEIADDFKQNGHHLNWNQKKNHFDVTSTHDKEAQEKEDAARSDRKQLGFSSTGKRRTQTNVGGGHSANGIKKA